MGVYVMMIKISENEDNVRYFYGPNEGDMGIIELNKNEKKFEGIETIKDSSVSDELYFNIAAQRLSVCLIRNKGKFPERMTIAS